MDNTITNNINNPILNKSLTEIISSTENDNNKPIITEVLHKHNLKVDDFVKCLKRGLSAKRVIKDRDGEVVDEVEDMNVQHKFFVSGMELLGYLHGSSTVVNVGVSEVKKEAEEAYNRWRSLNSQENRQ